MSVKAAVAALAVALTLFGLQPAVALAADPRVEATSPDFAAGKVMLTATGPEASTVEFRMGDDILGSLPARDGAASWGPVRLSRQTTVTALGRSGDGVVRWTVTSLLDPADFAPDRAIVDVRPGSAIPASTTVSVSAPVTITAVAIALDIGGPVRAHTATAGPDSPVAIAGVRMPWGPGWMRVRVRNAFGASPPVAIRVYNVGTLRDIPARGALVLVHKRVMRAYQIRDRKVVRTWPVATGMHSTPTPDGHFRLARAEAAGGSWGVLRRRLYRRTGGTWRKTSYYIHGTNDPWSIGMMASHGCVRMYNSHIRQFSRVVPTGTLVRIR